jgi:hypothetical protein
MNDKIYYRDGLNIIKSVFIDEALRVMRKEYRDRWYGDGTDGIRMTEEVMESIRYELNLKK